MQIAGDRDSRYTSSGMACADLPYAAAEGRPRGPWAGVATNGSEWLAKGRTSPFTPSLRVTGFGASASFEVAGDHRLGAA